MQRHAVIATALGLMLTWGGGVQAASAAPAAPSVLKVGVLGSFGSLDPLLASTQAASDVLGATSDGLMSYRPATAGGHLHYVWRPDLLAAAPRITIVGTPGPEADVTIVYHLRRGLRWSDGRPLTAKDIRFTWQAIMEPGNGAYQAGYNQITSIDTPSRLTAVVHMHGTFAAWQTLFSELLPWHALHGRVATVATDKSYNRHPLSTGPYAVHQYGASTVVLVPNPYYAGQDGPRPTFKEIVVSSYSRQSDLVTALQQHEVDLADLLSLSTPEVHTLRGRHLVVASVPSAVFEQFTFNLRDPIASDPGVRRAFYLALNRQQIAARISGDRWQVATSDQPPWSWAFNPKVPVVKQNIAQARAVLQQDGWQIGSDGYFQKNGQELILDVSLTRTPLHAAIMKYVSSEEAQAGIRVLPVYFSTQALFGPNGMFAQGTYQVGEFGLMNNVDPDDAAIWNSELGSPYHQGDDFSGYQNPNVNAWTQDALSQMNQSLRAQDYRQVQMQLYQDLPMVPLFYVSTEAAYNPAKLSHVALSAYTGTLWDANAWRPPKR